MMKILVAEDDKIVRTILKENLISWGYDPVITSDGEEAWEILKKQDAPRIIILDWVIPGLSGIKICRKLRQRSSYVPVYIILLTGKISTEDVVAGFEAGADDYVTKPFNGPELRARVKAGARILYEMDRIGAARSFKENLAVPLIMSGKEKKNIRMMIAEDDPISRAILMENLTGWGYNVTPAEDGAEAWEILNGQSPPQIAVLDWMMPKKSGIEICRLAREHKDLQHLYIIMLTTLGDAEHIAEGFKAGVDDYISKPFSAAELRARIGVGTRICAFQSYLSNRAKQAKADFKSIFDNAVEGIYQITEDGRLITANSSFASIYGYDTPGDMMEISGIADRLYLKSGRFIEFRQAMEKDDKIVNFESEIRRKDKTTAWIAQSGRVVRDDQGDILYYEVFVQDITLRVRAEQKLKKLNANLENIVAERTAELSDAKNAAENTSKVKSKFLANMSHELRTPLNAILGFSQVLRKQYFGKLNEKQGNYVKEILDAGDHLLNLINDILDLSKVEAGKMEMNISDVSIKNLMENSTVMVKEKLHKHGINLELEIPDELDFLKIKADEIKLKQIMFNLLSNAAKFTPDGGKIKICAKIIHEPDPLGEVSIKVIKISIKDTGIGLSKENLDNIFKTFYQAEGGVKTSSAGTGIGLSLTRKLVEMHNGKIWAESPGHGKGSTFAFIIPFTPEPAKIKKP